MYSKCSAIRLFTVSMGMPPRSTSNNQSSSSVSSEAGPRWRADSILCAWAWRLVNGSAAAMLANNLAKSRLSIWGFYNEYAEHLGRNVRRVGVEAGTQPTPDCGSRCPTPSRSSV